MKTADDGLGPFDPVSSLLRRICEAVYVCPECGATLQGKDVRIHDYSWDYVAASDGSPIPTFQHCLGRYCEVIDGCRI